MSQHLRGGICQLNYIDLQSVRLRGLHLNNQIICYQTRAFPYRTHGSTRYNLLPLGRFIKIALAIIYIKHWRKQYVSMGCPNTFIAFPQSQYYNIIQKYQYLHKYIDNIYSDSVLWVKVILVVIYKIEQMINFPGVYKTVIKYEFRTRSKVTQAVLNDVWELHRSDAFLMEFTQYVWSTIPREQRNVVRMTNYPCASPALQKPVNIASLIQNLYISPSLFMKCAQRGIS